MRVTTFVAILAIVSIAAPVLDVAAADPAEAVAPDSSGARTCLVLSGGGARGAAHIGVLKVLEQLRVPFDCIVGTSM